ncbi:Putative esterase [Corynebacterium auriscanis]|nr:Putative esterase [Corynebacterium auriscanis]
MGFRERFRAVESWFMVLCVRKNLNTPVENIKRMVIMALAALTAVGGAGAVPSVAEFTGTQAQAQPAPLAGPPLPGSAVPPLQDVRLPNGQMLSQVIPGASNLFKKPHKPAARPVLPGNAKPAPRIGNGRAMWVHTRSTGRDRRYLVHMPTHYNPRRPAPVLFGLDGWRDTPENFRRYSRLHETGAAREAIRIYPESLNHGGEGAPYAVVRPGEDLKFITQIIAEVDRTYNVDRSRIYATGHSNGGGMTAVVACHLPHIFAGAAAVGGAFYDPVNRGCSNRPIPFLISHGTGDTMMKYHGGYRHNGSHYLAVPVLVNSYKKRNGCVGVPRVTNIPGGKRHVYPCARKELQLLTNPQNHTWNRVPDASQEVWNFLKRQRL